MVEERAGGGGAEYPTYSREGPFEHSVYITQV